LEAFTASRDNAASRRISNETFIADRRRRLRIRGNADAIRFGDAPRNARHAG
jgi:hypothetical protein